MGNLSNLFISTSYQSLIHLGNDSTVSSSLVELQDGLGNSIGVSVNSAGDLSISGSLTASLEEGYALVGGVGNETKAVPTSSFGSNVDLGPLNQFTASQDILNDTFATTGSNTFNGDQRITGSLNIQEANSEITLRNASGTGEVKLTSGPDYITSFADASLTGISVIGANYLSGSWGYVGNYTNVGIYNSNISATTAGDIRLVHGTNYNSFQSNRTNGTLSLKGDTITLNGSSSLDSGVKLIVKGQVIASGSLTASLQEGYVWVGDSNGKSKTVATSSFQTTINTGSFLTTSSFNVYTASTDSALDNLEIFTASQESKDNTLGIYTSSVDTKFSTIGTQSGSWDNTLLNQFTSSQETQNSTLASYTGSVNTQLTNLSTSQSIDDSKWNTLGSQSGSFVLESETGSFARTNIDNTFGGTQSFLNIAVAGTASIAYLQSVTGSAKIIGDAFIILNNDTPAERYAGIIVQDSGSTQTTASFEFDGQTNDWFYDYTTDGGVTTDYGVALFGPEYSTKGTPTYLTNNRIPKSVGSHHLNDSSISDDGTTVSVGANLSVTGSIQSNGTSVLLDGALSNLNSYTASQDLVNTQLLNASTSFEEKFTYIGTQSGSWSGGGTIVGYATTGSNIFVDKQTISANGIEITGSVNLTPASVSTNANYVIPFISGSTISKDSVDTLFYNPLQNSLFVSASTGRSSLTTAGYAFASGSGADAYQARLTKSEISQTAGAGYTIGISGNPSSTGYTGLTTSTNPGIFATSGSGESYVAIELQTSQSFTDGRVTIKRPLIAEEGSEITGSLTVSNDITADRLVLTGGTGIDLIVTGSGRISNTLNVGPATGDQSYMSSYGFSAVNSTTGDETGITNNGLDYGVSGWNGPSIYGNDPTDSYPALIGFQNKTDWTDGTISILKPLNVTGSVSISGNVTASLQQGYVWVGDVNGKTTTVPTSSFGGGGTIVGYATTGSNIFVGSQQITGSLSVSGSINNSVHTLSITSNTASIDASVGTTFVLSLVDATNTRLEVSNTTYGQTLNLLVSQSAAGTGTLTFGGNFYEPSGSFYSASAVASAKDIVTLATFVEPNVVYVASIKNLIV